MENLDLEDGNDGSTVGSLLAGLLIGGLAGAGAMLLLAPESGQATRARIRQKGVEWRDQMAETEEDALAQARDKAQQIAADVQAKAQELQQRSQEVLEGQKERWSSVVKAKEKSAQGSEG